MKIKDALKLAINSTHVDDPLEVQALRKGLDIVKAECPFIEFIDGPAKDVPFRAEVAHVATQSEGKNNTKIRHVRCADGRKTFVVPSLRLEEPIDGWLTNPYFRTEEGILDMADRTAYFFGHSYTGRLRKQILQGLLSVAEGQERVIRTRPEKLKQVVGDVVRAIDGASSVLSNAQYAAKASDDYLNRTVAIDGQVRLVYELDQDVLIVVPDEPIQVGFVRSDTLPEMFVAVASPGLIRSSVVFECGFCFWGDAPITKIIVEKNG